MDKVLIIGASNIDFIGKSKNKLIKNDSNIGTVKVAFGGVGRNVCENLACLGVDTSFITAIGNDDLGSRLKNELEELNVKLIIPKTGLETSNYMAIHDINGDMAYAISDMKIVDEINPEFIAENLKLENDYKYIVLDGNLNKTVINYILNRYQNKFIVDGISTNKVLKFKDNLEKLFLLKANIYEAQALANENLKGRELIEKLFSIGLRQVIVTDGANDIYYGSNNMIGKIKVEKVRNIVNATGAGDSMLAGIILGLLKNKELKDAIEIGKKISKITLLSTDAVSKDINKNTITF